MTASRRDRMRPFEVIGLAVIVAVFTGIVVISTTRNITLAAIWLGVAFIAMLVVSATVVLMIQPKKEELADIEELAAAAPAKSAAAPAKKSQRRPRQGPQEQPLRRKRSS